MEYIYSVLLLHSLGKEITAENISKIFTALGTNVDEAHMNVLLKSLEGVNIEDALKSEIMMPMSAPLAQQITPLPAAVKVEKKEEVKKEEKKVTEEEAAEGLSALFG